MKAFLAVALWFDWVPKTRLQRLCFMGKELFPEFVTREAKMRLILIPEIESYALAIRCQPFGRGQPLEQAIAGRIGRGHGRGPVLPNRISGQNISNAQVFRPPTTLFF